MAPDPIQPDWHLDHHGADARLRLAGDWIARRTGLRDPTSLDAAFDDAGAITQLRIEASELGRWDSALIVFVLELRRVCAARHIAIDETGLPPAALRLLALTIETESTVAPAPAPHDSLLQLIGQEALSLRQGGVAIAELVGDSVLRGSAAMRGRVLTRLGDVLALMREAGPGALLIVTIVNGLVGAILAFVGAVQLRRFGAEIFVADLVGIALVREMAAVMTAIVMAGRTGGAYAAHIATMQGNEEIDALEVFGIPVFDYLVLPRIGALVAMLPLLYLYACAVGLIGGLVVSISVLDLNAVTYIEETRKAIAGRHFIIGLTKSVAFGALVALAGCHIGLRAGRSAADVGRAATSAVVVGIIGIIALDAIFALCTNALGI